MNTPWFDREEILTLLKKRVEGFLVGYRQNIALLGREGVGKSTLLKRLIQQELSAVPALIPLYVEVQEEESFSEWTARFVQTVLLHFSDAPGTAAATQRLQVVRPPLAAAAAERLLVLAESGRAEEVYDQLWDLPHLITQEKGLPCLLVLDEFHRLSSLGVKDPFGRLGRKIMVQSMTMYLVASSRPEAARSILREGLNLLFGQFETLLVDPMDPSACVRTIRAALFNEKEDPFLEHLLVELAQGYPGYLDLLLQGLLDRRVLEEASVNRERSLLDLLEELLIEPRGALRIRFEAQIRFLPAHQNRRSWVQVLMAVAAGNHRIPQIAEATGRSFSQVAGALKALGGVGLVQKQGVFYRMPDRLFQLWMLAAYPVLRGIDLTDPAHARVRFRDGAWIWMAKIHEAMVRPLEEHGADLLRQWGGELVEAEGRRVHLPRFSRVELRKNSIGRVVILAHRSRDSEVTSGAASSSRSHGPDWLVVPWNGSLDESQARSLVKELLEPPFKDYRKLVLGACPVEVNARLVFQQARIRFWDLAVFNDLLDLYGLARIGSPEAGRRSPFETIRLDPNPLPPSRHDLELRNGLASSSQSQENLANS
ncbi:MAG: GTPase domain-containing protein [Candidatus Omnitrophica bacterium]|nr:GTPase domain-containing protein [Candidatus Omnitrophota bacterium]